MQKPNIAIRADGNAKIGLGHIHRTLALASYLKDFFEIKYYSVKADELVCGLVKSSGFILVNLKDSEEFISEISKTDIVVLDGYSFKTDYQKALKTNGNKVIAIDDLNEWENVADVVINHGYSGKEYKLSSNSKLYAGLEYAIIKSEILGASKSQEKKSTNKVLVCIGGTDPEGYSEKIVTSLLKETEKQISILTYPLNSAFKSLEKLASQNEGRLKLFHSLDTTDLMKLIQSNDIAILQPSNIALEAAALGIHISLIQTAENQKYILGNLVNNSCAVKLDADHIGKDINSITLEHINEQIKKQSKLLDGKSPARILDVVNSLLLECRKVKESDIKLIYDWNNDPVTRANSHNKAKIEFANHEKWFAGRLKDEQLDFLIFSYNTIPCGSVRILREETENVIGIAIAPEFRGKKLAGLILNMAADYFYERHGNKEITAYIKKQNVASIMSFEKAGYKITNEGEYCGDAGYRLIKK
ncbi:MAG: UDP-2,4-diacetamido-2,4,6-trideoxy-beta-L-altropyranose hydrolase [Sphingobacteriaceae bacterium]|nr:UDP-2,4-diacetamido-2,4,6-trideoxy-beta-L-altropyranose hydrolase [Sphingobacteriaceae bacterium]